MSKGELMPRKVEDASILEMALVGYQIELQKVDARIRELQIALQGKGGSSLIRNSASDGKPVKRQLSEAARNRIAAAQRKRWAEHRKLKAQAAKS